jgi:hypothetical protein
MRTDQHGVNPVEQDFEEGHQIGDACYCDRRKEASQQYPFDQILTAPIPDKLNKPAEMHRVSLSCL